MLSASIGGYTDIVRLLLADSRVDPSDYDNEAILCACRCGHVNVVRVLLADSRVNPAVRDNTPYLILVGVVMLKLFACC